VKAGAGAALVGDHERKTVAARAPDFHIVDSTVKLQGHQQSFTNHLSSKLSARTNSKLDAVRAASRPVTGLSLDTISEAALAEHQGVSKRNILSGVKYSPHGVLRLHQADHPRSVEARCRGDRIRLVTSGFENAHRNANWKPPVPRQEQSVCAAYVRNRTHRHRLSKRSIEPDFTGVLKNRPLLIRLGKLGRFTTSRSNNQK
jgi:hypothetical protein